MNDTDFQAITQVQQKTWSEGDFGMIANLIVDVADDLVRALEILPGERVLDVACGSGNGAIAAARKAWGNTVGADFVPALLARGRERAAVEGLDVEFVEADAQDLPFEDGSFDVTISIFGSMFAPDQQRAADELVRVTRPGGRIAMANWVPDGEAGQMFKTIAQHAPPPPGVQPPLLWGTEERLRELFGEDVSDLRVERRSTRQGFHSADHYLEVFRTYFGPMKMAFERVGADGEAALEADLREFVESVNAAGDRALVMEPEYLQVIATRA